MSEENDRIKITKFQMAEARFVHEEVIRPSLWKWVDGILIQVVEHKRYGWPGRLFHFIVEYFYISKILRIRIERSQHTTLLGGKGYRAGHQRQRLDRVGSTVYKRGVKVAHQDFPLGIII